MGVIISGNTNFSVCVGVMQILAFLDTNMLVSPKQNSRVWGIVGVLPNTTAQRECFCVTVEYRLKELNRKPPEKQFTLMDAESPKT